MARKKDSGPVVVCDDSSPRSTISVITSEDGKEIPKPETPRIDTSLPKDVIKYGSRVFEVYNEIFHSLGKQPDVIPQWIKIALGNDMGFIYPDGVFGCGYCNFYKQNIARSVKTFMENYDPKKDSSRVILHDDPGEIGTRVMQCEYPGDEEIRWASSFKNEETGKFVMGQKQPCVVYDAMIEVLAREGILDDYEIQGKEFNYPTLDELKADPKLCKRFEVNLGVYGPVMRFLRKAIGVGF